MYARIALSVVLAAAFCAPSGASRKFTGSQSLVYESEDPIVEGLDEFGLSLWILVRDDGGEAPSTQGIIDNLCTPDGDGFALYYERVDKARSVVFRYQGELSRAKSGLIETRAKLGLTQIGKWIHVAADLSLTTAMKTRARIWINGRPGKVESGPPFKAMTGSPMLFVGGRPRPDGSGGDTGFRGDVHDVCIVDHCWTRKQLNQLSKQKQSARDVAPLSTIRFNPRLRDNAGKDDISGIVPDILGAPIKGMGPPLIYGDQKPTVLVIGDTQAMDGYPGDIPTCSEDDSTPQNKEVGHWVWSGGDQKDWLCRPRNLIDQFRDDEIPWACTLGNHDYTWNKTDGHPPTRDVSYWASDSDTTMPDWLFTEEDWHIAQMGAELEGVDYEHADGDYVHAFTFELDGVTQLGIALPYGLTTHTLDWACDIARDYCTDEENHPGLRVWIITHYFLSSMGGYHTNAHYCFSEDDEPTWGAGRSAADAVADWFKDENEEKNIDDLAFVFCGHTCSGAKHKDDTTRSDLPFYGVHIDYCFSDYQKLGMMHILADEVDGGELKRFYVETYAPRLDEFIDDDKIEGSVPTFEGWLIAPQPESATTGSPEPVVSTPALIRP